MPTNDILRRRPANKPTLFKEGALWGCCSWLLGYRVSGWGRRPKDAYRAWLEDIKNARKH